MSDQEKPIQGPDNRKYIRLKTVFPVDFAIARSEDNLLDLSWQQGYTSNVSKGGICLETVHLNEKMLQHVHRQGTLLELKIYIPIHKAPIKAIAQVSWFKKDQYQSSDKYFIGLEFTEIEKKSEGRILSHARWFKYSAQTAMGLSIILFIALMAASFYNYKLRMVNETIVNNLVSVQQLENEINQSLDHVTETKKSLLNKMNKISNDGKRAKLENQYEMLIARENQIVDKLDILEREKSGLKDTVAKKMYKWLKNRQHPSTGLILSFEGDVNVIKDWAFIYDQALAANVFLIFKDYRGARGILNFFNREARVNFRGFFNAYYYDSGDVSEFTIHCGPNIWVGIAAMQYLNHTQDETYLPLAQKIADWLITIQDRDPAGGLKGGPKYNWFATEHNLDAYAFFSMLYLKTKNEKYKAARDKALSWVNRYALSPHSRDYKSPPVNRGRGDATIATDTFAWSLAAIGIDKLSELGMDPEKIMEFAEDHCRVDIQYKRPSGVSVDVFGFDFSKVSHMPRGGLISPEWTSQMIIAYQLLSNYFYAEDKRLKAKYYGEKGESYLNELNKLVISSPSAKGQGEGCLPYATLENANTGHGWNTPFGSSTCSIAGTAYTLLAIKGFNPLMLE